MDHIERYVEPSKRLDGVRSRAALLNLNIKDLCAAAGQKSNTVYRWIRGNHDPRMGNFGQTIGALEDELDRREFAIFFALAPKFLPADILETLDLSPAVIPLLPAGGECPVTGSAVPDSGGAGASRNGGA